MEYIQKSNEQIIEKLIDYYANIGDSYLRDYKVRSQIYYMSFPRTNIINKDIENQMVKEIFEKVKIRKENSRSFTMQDLLDTDQYIIDNLEDKLSVIKRNPIYKFFHWLKLI